MTSSLPYEPNPESSAPRAAVTAPVPAVDYVPSPEQIEIRYTLSPEDVNLAHNLPRSPAPGEPPPITPPAPAQRKHGFRSGLAGWLLFVSLAVLLVMLVQR